MIENLFIWIILIGGMITLLLLMLSLKNRVMRNSADMAFRSGRSAFENNIPISSNPFSDEVMGAHWSRGWVQAMKTRESLDKIRGQI